LISSPERKVGTSERSDAASTASNTFMAFPFL
jgi:hypothetical protein